MSIKSLSETSIGKYMIELGYDFRKYPAYVAKNAEELDSSNLQEVFSKIRMRSFKYPAKSTLLKMFDSGRMKLVYLQGSIPTEGQFGATIPFYLQKAENGGYVIVINLTTFADMDKLDNIKIDPITLYTLMLSGANYLAINRTINTIKDGIPELFAAMFVNVLGRMTTMNNKLSLMYLAMKYMDIQLGADEERASRNCTAKIKSLSAPVLRNLDEQLPIDAYEGIREFVDAISQTFPEYNDVTFGDFFNTWTSTFGETASLSMEFIPMMYTMLISMVMNSTITNYRSIESDMGRNDKLIQSTFNKIEKSINNIYGN